MPAGWAAGIGAAIGGIGAIVGSGQQASGQEAAAQTQQNMFNTIVGQEQPFLNAGYGGINTLSGMLGPGGYLTQQFNPTQDQLNNYPGYQFSLQQGGQALRNADTPGIGALSGAALKDLINYNQNTANTFYGNYFNQFQTQQNNIFDRLQGLASLGQNAAGNLGSAGANLGSGIAQAQAAAGASLGAGYSGALNSAGSGLTLSALMSQYGGGGGGVLNSYGYSPNPSYSDPGYTGTATPITHVPDSQTY